MLRTSTSVSLTLAACLLACGAAARADMVPAFTAPGIPAPGSPSFWGNNVDATLSRNGNGTFTLSVVGSSAGCGSAHTRSGCSAATFNLPGAAYLVGNESISITANFSASGMFTSGAYSITGSLPASSSPLFGSAPAGVSWGAQGTETLLTANLTGDAVDSSDEALGFNEVITGGWADQPQFASGGPESVWLYSLLSGFDGDRDQNDQGNQGSSGCWKRGFGCRIDSGHKGDSAWDRFLAELQSGRGLKPGKFTAIGSIATVPLPGAVLLLGSGLLGLAGMARRRRLSVAS
jgi:hypothetical protein